jgi:hypothetical protein
MSTNVSSESTKAKIITVKKCLLFPLYSFNIQDNMGSAKIKPNDRKLDCNILSSTYTETFSIHKNVMKKAINGKNNTNESFSLQRSKYAISNTQNNAMKI